MNWPSFIRSHFAKHTILQSFHPSPTNFVICSLLLLCVRSYCVFPPSSRSFPLMGYFAPSRAFVFLQVAKLRQLFRLFFSLCPHFLRTHTLSLTTHIFAFGCQHYRLHRVLISLAGSPHRRWQWLPSSSQ